NRWPAANTRSSPSASAFSAPLSEPLAPSPNLRSMSGTCPILLMRAIAPPAVKPPRNPPRNPPRPALLPTPSTFLFAFPATSLIRPSACASPEPSRSVLADRTIAPVPIVLPPAIRLRSDTVQVRGPSADSLHNDAIQVVEVGRPVEQQS